MNSWSSGRAAEGDGFENRCTERYRGFESLLLRSENVADSKRQATSKSAKNKEVTASESGDPAASDHTPKVPTGDSTGTAGVTSSDKPSNKPADLAAVVEAWPRLPEAIRSAILTLVRAAEDRK